MQFLAVPAVLPARSSQDALTWGRIGRYGLGCGVEPADCFPSGFLDAAPPPPNSIATKLRRCSSMANIADESTDLACLAELASVAIALASGNDGRRGVAFAERTVRIGLRRAKSGDNISSLSEVAGEFGKESKIDPLLCWKGQTRSRQAHEW